MKGMLYGIYTCHISKLTINKSLVLVPDLR